MNKIKHEGEKVGEKRLCKILCKRRTNCYKACAEASCNSFIDFSQIIKSSSIKFLRISSILGDVARWAGKRGSCCLQVENKLVNEYKLLTGFDALTRVKRPFENVTQPQATLAISPQKTPLFSGKYTWLNEEKGSCWNKKIIENELSLAQRKKFHLVHSFLKHLVQKIMTEESKYWPFGKNSKL